VPAALGLPLPDGPRNRLTLAKWLTDRRHPLTARVVVNRLWAQLFGTGLVKTLEDFGSQSEWPSHPELLDWLARGPRYRLPAEILRDQALAVSGLLKNRLGGPSVYPYQPDDLYKGVVVAADYPGTRYVVSKGDDLYRRSLYTFWKRTLPHPVMTVFDAPDREFCVVRRSTTNTPLQALTLLNNPIFVEAARKLAERSIREGGAAADARVRFAFRLATGRVPDAEEQKLLVDRLAGLLATYRADEPAARALAGVGASGSDGSIALPELAAYTALANIILNLDEVVTLG
jgi:hypothetical protein